MRQHLLPLNILSTFRKQVMSSTYIYNPTILYIKLHVLTGKLYFGKTSCKSRIDNINSYYGSGSYWSDHIKMHGKNHVVTLWKSDIFYNKEQLLFVSIYLSLYYNIVFSDFWANLELEDGLNGSRNPKKGPRGPLSKPRKLKSDEDKEKLKGPRGPNKNKRGPMSENNKESRRGPQKNPNPNRSNPRGISGKAGKIYGKQKNPSGPFFTILLNKNTYSKKTLSRYYPEFKQYY